MKKTYTLAIFALLFSLGNINAQQISDPTIRKDNTIIRCYTTQAMLEDRALRPGAETDTQFESWMSAQIAKRKSAKTTTVNYTLPIIFHIISAGEAVGTSPNLDASFIKAQVMLLNQTYGNQAGSPYAVSANSGLTFALAQKNPSGTVLAEPGIDRINRVTKGWTDYGTTGWDRSYVESTVKPGSTWDATRYINVWVMPGLVSGTSTLIGYATFPASSGLPGLNSTETTPLAGVAIITSSIGSSYTKSSCAPTNPYTTGKSLVHEFGHFFGLRHIWGDATCGDDYCNDTPASESANYGVYYHPKSNTCGTPDEMFENYMDYTDDVMLNTFTADQVARIQTVMLNSPRRNTLPTSNAGFVPVVGSNNVAFIDYCVDSLSIPETGVKSSGNQYYRDLYVNVTTEDKATDVATVTFTTAGTAVNGVDYQLLTPVINYAVGEATKSTVVRVFDNAAVDGDKSIILGLSISGVGVTAGTAHQTLQINIKDDDNVKIGQNPINMLNESFEVGTGTNNLPVGWRALKTANPSNTFVGSANGSGGPTASGQCAHISSSTATKPDSYIRGTSGAAVIQSLLIDPNGYQSLGNLSFKYRIRGRGTPAAPGDYAITTYTLGLTTGPFYYWNSTASLSGAGPYCTNSATPITGTPTIPAPAGIGNQKFTVSFYWATGTATTGGDPGFNVDDVVLTGNPFNIETAVSNSYGFRIPAFTNNNFRSNNQKQIVNILNASNDVNGVVASVAEAGNDQATISTEAGTYFRSRKVISINPATPNSSTSITATIYFTQAEINIWGADKSSVQIIQVDNPGMLNGPLNPSNAKLLVPLTVTDNLATDGYIAYTFTTDGFGTFAIVSPTAALPLKLLNFTGTLKSNVANLKWNTANEVNTKGFDVERSVDGNTFIAIGFVKSLNRVSNEYSLNDEKIVKGNRYYYRLKMMDVDGKFNYSNVVTINFMDKEKWFAVYPSPVKDVLYIQNNTNASQNAEIVITEVNGKIVYKHNGSVSGKLEIPVASWSAGTYVVKIKSNEAETTHRIVKQ